MTSGEIGAMKTIKDETIRAVVADYNNGLSLQKVANKYRISATRVFKIVHEHGTPRSGKFPEATIEKVRELYMDENMSLTEVCDELGLTINQVRGIISRNEFIKDEYKRDLRLKGNFSKPLNTCTVIDPIYYPERIVPKKTVVINNQKYQDMSAYFGL